jgi:hypothetical protein
MLTDEYSIQNSRDHSDYHYYLVLKKSKISGGRSELGIADRRTV